MDKTIKRVLVAGVRGGLPMNEAFRLVQSGGIVELTLTPNKYHPEAFSGIARVKAYETKRGRPAKVDKTPEFPSGSTTLVLEALDKSGRTFSVNWRRDYDAVADMKVLVVEKPTKPVEDTVKISATANAVVEIPATPEMIAAASALDAAVSLTPTA